VHSVDSVIVAMHPEVALNYALASLLSAFSSHAIN